MDPRNLPAGKSRNKRGRPRRDGDGVREAIKIRREQNRIAQQTFKARRLAAQAETENRIAHLEKTIESMVELFLKTTDNVMSFASVRQHPNLSRHIRDSILQCLSLVRGSITVDCEGDESEKSCMDSYHHIAVPSTARSDQIAMVSDSYAPFLKDENNSRNVESYVALELDLGGWLEVEHTLSPGASNPFYPTIDGLLCSFYPSQSINIYSEYSRSSVSIELIRCTLGFAYNVLHNAVDLSTGLVAKMFGVSLQSHSKEQLLSKLTWSLEPGSSILGEFASIDTTTSSQASGASEQISAFNTVSYSSGSSLINAEGVVSWLDSIGVRRIDEDTLEVPIWNQATPLDVGGVVPGLFQGQYSFLNADVFFSPTQSTIIKGRVVELTKSSKDYTTACTTRISQSALFRYLSEMSVCLDTGVAYHRQHLVRLVMASQVC
ncbi:hypothetical protein V8C35DRAFT_318748 [Trichoderma chlorosporum]